MFGALKQVIKSLLEPKPAVPAGQEVAVATFTLEETDAGDCRRMHMGEELVLLFDGQDTPVVGRGDRIVGSVPEAERPHMTKLLTQGARLNCRVVKLGAGALVRVRVSIVL